MKTKYITFENRYGVETMVIFEASTPHADVLTSSNKVISAGFIDPKTGECYGRSEGLDLPSRPHTDTMIARRLLNLG